MTGIRLRAGEEGTKKTIELVHELLPGVTTIGKLINPTFVDAEPEVTEVDAAARSLGLTVVFARATRESEPITSSKAGGLIGNRQRRF